MKLIICLLLLITLSLQDSYNLDIGRVTLALSNVADCMMDDYLGTCAKNPQYSEGCMDFSGDIPAWWNVQNSLFAPINSDYQIKSIVWNTQSNIEPYGIVVVNDKTKSVYLVFHGTKTPADLDYDNSFGQTQYLNSKCITDSSAKVHKGFYSLYNQISPKITTLLQSHFSKDYTLYIAGHSLGGALASLAMADIYCQFKNGIYQFKDVILYNSAPPRVGNAQWKNAYQNFIPLTNTWSLVNTLDPIPQNPPTELIFWYTPTGQFFQYTVNWNVNCTSQNSFNITGPCVTNHDPACIYYYALSQMKDQTTCDCTQNPSCYLCIKCNLYSTQLPDGCPILPSPPCTNNNNNNAKSDL